MIHTFEFEDYVNGWKLEKVKFDQLNLLVGGSGVGKSKIIESLLAVRAASTKLGASASAGSEWSLVLEINGENYEWKAKTSPSNQILKQLQDSRNREDGEEIFLRESLTQGDKLIFDRDETRIILNEKELPPLNSAESLLYSYNSVPEVKPFYNSIRKFVYSITNRENHFVSAGSSIHELEEKTKSFQELQESIHPSMVKAFILYNKFREEFNRIVERYIDIFPFITEVKISLRKEFIATKRGEPEVISNRIILAIREKGVGGWIMEEALSSGMRKAFWQLVELSLVPEGSNILIDEFENSLGVNCLPQVTDLIKSRVGEVQFIMTSHHPYIINNIHREHWKVVTRKGGRTTVRSYREIPALQTKSHHKAFTLLINLDEYENGVQYDEEINEEQLNQTRE